MPFIKLPDKDPEEVLDYTVDFDGIMAESVQLAATGHSALVESSSPNESPFDLALATSPQAVVTAVQSPAVSPEILDSIQICLINGTVGTKYTVKITAIDEAVGHQRTFVRRVTCKVKKR